MRKYLLIIFLLVILISGCASKEIVVYSDDQVDEFNSILENVGDGKTKAYDLREYDECYASRIPGFYCSRIEDINNEIEALDRIVNNLSLLLGSKKNTLIILIDNDGKNSAYVASKLFDLGYKNVHYFKNGYEKYVSLNEDFVPESGECDC